jgi:hypothetical protein
VGSTEKYQFEQSNTLKALINDGILFLRRHTTTPGITLTLTTLRLANQRNSHWISGQSLKLWQKPLHTRTRLLRLANGL